jgi:phosphohistidine phosphatase
MEIYLLRHGAAENVQPGHTDAERRLTGEGKNKTAEVVKMARRGGLEKPLVISSPYVRAVETARIVMEELAIDDLIRTPALVPHGGPEAVWSELREYSDARAVLLAGHEPLRGRLAAYLLNSPALQVEMKKSAMVRVDVEALRAAPRGILRWMITPRLALEN